MQLEVDKLLMQVEACITFLQGPPSFDSFDPFFSYPQPQYHVSISLPPPCVQLQPAPPLISPQALPLPLIINACSPARLHRIMMSPREVSLLVAQPLHRMAARIRPLSSLFVQNGHCAAALLLATNVLLSSCLFLISPLGAARLPV